jgi:hypothetical protein
MSSDEHLETSSARRFTRFSLATMFVLVTAVAVAITIGLELSKSEVTAYVQMRRSTAAAGWPRDWSDEMSADEFDMFRRTQVELMRSKSLLTRVMRDALVSTQTFLGRAADPIGWLEKNLKFDFPNDGELLRVRLLTHDTDEGAAIVNAVVRMYFKEVVEKDMQNRNRTEQTLQTIASEMDERIVRDKKEAARLAGSLGAQAATRSAELEQKEARIRQREKELDEVTWQLYRWQLSKRAPSRVLQLDDAIVTP